MRIYELVQLIFFSNLPLANTLTPESSFLITLVSTNRAGDTTVPSSNLFKSVRFTTAYSLRLIFWKPRFGIRRNNGVCPPRILI